MKFGIYELHFARNVVSLTKRGTGLTVSLGACEGVGEGGIDMNWSAARAQVRRLDGGQLVAACAEWFPADASHHTPSKVRTQGGISSPAGSARSVGPPPLEDAGSPFAALADGQLALLAAGSARSSPTRGVSPLSLASGPSRKLATEGGAGDGPSAWAFGETPLPAGSLGAETSAAAAAPGIVPVQDASGSGAAPSGLPRGDSTATPPAAPASPAPPGDCVDDAGFEPPAPPGEDGASDGGVEEEEKTGEILEKGLCLFAEVAAKGEA